MTMAAIILHLVALAALLFGFTNCCNDILDTVAQMKCSAVDKYEAQEKIDDVKLIFYPGCLKQSAFIDKRNSPDLNQMVRSTISRFLKPLVQFFTTIFRNKSVSKRNTSPSCLENSITVPLNRSIEILQHEEFDKEKCFVLFIYGYQKSPTDTLTTHISNAYVKQGKWNYLVLDYSSVAGITKYNESVSLLNDLGPAVAEHLDDLMDAGVNMCHMSGHSMGAQLAGTIARNMRHTVPHLILLDPAGPLFYPPHNCTQAVSKEDAECVEVLHTDDGGLGSPSFPGGHVDYYPNGGGRRQPDCNDPRLPCQGTSSEETSCSHDRAIYYYTDSMYSPGSLVAVNCLSWEDFNRGLCDRNVQMTMGSCSKTSTPGKYFMHTNGREPYGQGEKGIIL